MKIIQTDTMTPPSAYTEALQIYNGLDCCVTMEVFEAIAPMLDNNTSSTYAFSRSLQGPCLDMALAGVEIDLEKRAELIGSYLRRLNRLEEGLNRILSEGIGLDMNWNSPAQMKHLFYKVMGIPEITKRNATGQTSATVDRGALEKLETYHYAQPIVSHLLAMRDLAKKISTLKTSVDRDGCMRTTYNIAGTNTGRLSSSFSILGTGGNFQNWEEQLRRIFVARKGKKFAYIDLEQAESRLVGAIEYNLFSDSTYLDACESGDLHTAVAKLAWPDLPWTGTLSEDKAIAETPFYRQHSYRHMAKVLGHGTNYAGQPWTMSKHTKIETPVIKEFQSAYFNAFPAHRRWHEWVIQSVRSDGWLVNLMGRKRWFHGRRDDAETHRAAIAFDPQGSVGDIQNMAMLQVWRLGICQLLMQVHDAILVEYDEGREEEILPQVIKAIEVPVELRGGRKLIIPSEAKVGWNWSNYCCGGDCKGCPSKGKENLDGLRKYKPTAPDTRRRTPPRSQLDQLLCSVPV